MIVRNEEQTLPACLASAAGAVDEMIIVDTGSQDGTVDVARAAGAVVVPYLGTCARAVLDFATARNVGLEQARGDVVLVLDADETLDPASVPRVRALADRGGNTGYVVSRRNRAPGSNEVAFVDHAVRLFPRRPEYRYRHRIHETVDASILAAGGRLEQSSIVLHHHLPEEAGLRAKWTRYVELLRADLVIDPDDVDRMEFLAADLYKLGRYGEAMLVAERITQLCPNDVEPRIRAALLCFVHGHDPAAARRHLRAALAVEPDHPEARGLLAEVLAHSAKGSKGAKGAKAGGGRNRVSRVPGSRV
jgi:glycosyltransferase involved in cell wall biosynthesis